jgi:hypothetical protein
MSTWNSIKNKEAYNKGRHALRGDYIAHDHHVHPLAKVVGKKDREAYKDTPAYAADQARAARQQTADYNHIVLAMTRTSKYEKTRAIYRKARNSNAS